MPLSRKRRTNSNPLRIASLQTRHVQAQLLLPSQLEQQVIECRPCGVPRKTPVSDSQQPRPLGYKTEPPPGARPTRRFPDSCSRAREPPRSLYGVWQTPELSYRQQQYLCQIRCHTMDFVLSHPTSVARPPFVMPTRRLPCGLYTETLQQQAPNYPSLARHLAAIQKWPLQRRAHQLQPHPLKGRGTDAMRRTIKNRRKPRQQCQRVQSCSSRVISKATDWQ